jgi:hypothetical protein
MLVTESNSMQISGRDGKRIVRQITADAAGTATTPANQGSPLYLRHVHTVMDFHREPPEPPLRADDSY